MNKLLPLRIRVGLGVMAMKRYPQLPNRGFVIRRKFEWVPYYFCTVVAAGKTVCGGVLVV